MENMKQNNRLVCSFKLKTTPAKTHVMWAQLKRMVNNHDALNAKNVGGDTDEALLKLMEKAQGVFERNGDCINATLEGYRMVDTNHFQAFLFHRDHGVIKTTEPFEITTIDVQQDQMDGTWWFNINAHVAKSDNPLTNFLNKLEIKPHWLFALVKGTVSGYLAGYDEEPQEGIVFPGYFQWREGCRLVEPPKVETNDDWFKPFWMSDTLAGVSLIRKLRDWDTKGDPYDTKERIKSVLLRKVELFCEELKETELYEHFIRLHREYDAEEWEDLCKNSLGSDVTLFNRYLYDIHNEWIPMTIFAGANNNRVEEAKLWYGFFNMMLMKNYEGILEMLSECDEKW